MGNRDSKPLENVIVVTKLRDAIKGHELPPIFDEKVLRSNYMFDTKYHTIVEKYHRMCKSNTSLRDHLGLLELTDACFVQVTPEQMSAITDIIKNSKNIQN